MCGTCGCAHDGAAQRRIRVERSLLAENDRRAHALGERLQRAGIDVVGITGGPGSGKTALLEATLRRLGSRAAQHAVIEGDCATDRDARRIAACGARAVQIRTGSLCHLDAHLVEHALGELDLVQVERLWIENVGNLVCPAAFRCGERRRVVTLSVTEGDDKPEKYPALIASADLLIFTKLDLLPYVEFDVERCSEAARAIHPELGVLGLSARTGQGMAEWLDWVERGSDTHVSSGAR